VLPNKKKGKAGGPSVAGVESKATLHQQSDREGSASDTSKVTKTGMQSFGRQVTGRADSSLLKRMGSNQAPSAMFHNRGSAERKSSHQGSHSRFAAAESPSPPTKMTK